MAAERLQPGVEGRLPIADEGVGLGGVVTQRLRPRADRRGRPLGLAARHRRVVRAGADRQRDGDDQAKRRETHRPSDPRRADTVQWAWTAVSLALR